MIPQGIFLLKNGIENMADPLDLAGLSAMHPSWEAAAATLEPGEEIADRGMSLTRCGRNDDSLVIVGPCQSTMDVGWELDRLSGLSDWSGVLAPDQQQGRGQLRRAWVSPPGNLHVTLSWPPLPEKGPWAKAMPDLLSIVAGWVICESFAALGVSVEMKWPNDLMQAGKKVGGMLIEEKKGRILLGLGVNLAFSPPEDLMRRNFAAQAGKMAFPLRPESPLALCRTLVGHAKNVYAVLLDTMEPSEFLSLAAKRLAWLGREVLVREGGDESYRAVILGLSPKGGLTLLRDGSEVVLMSGSILPA